MFRGIELVQVIWKTVLGIVNPHIDMGVQFHGVLHGFQVVQLIGTAFLKVKMFQQLTSRD